MILYHTFAGGRHFPHLMEESVYRESVLEFNDRYLR